ncbi:hypothetical protein ABEB36_005434 [Hypothenemus hampei]|uniref:Beta-hexosaminidase n=1 Tax=Hypothenemus hampei TaxID=57062 RepID=A0ABD1EYT6_HYPHA
MRRFQKIKLYSVLKIIFHKMRERCVAVIFFCVFLILFVLQIYGNQNTESIRYDDPQSITNFNKWLCKNSKCEKTFDNNGTTWQTCKMLCNNIPPLWPKPKSIEIRNKNSSTFLKEHIFLSIHSSDENLKKHLEDLANEFLKTLTNEEFYLHDGDNQSFKLHLHVSSIAMDLSVDTNESYRLYSQKVSEDLLVNIFADNYFGIRHGIETLRQLIWYDELSKKFRIFHDILIQDEPSFPHRGLLIDVSRHYFPLNLLKKTVNGMTISKLNVLHLHISDVESFPLELNNTNILNVAYNAESRYTKEDIKELIEYARKRGIRVIIEVDAPSHVSAEAWPKSEVLCASPDVFKATLNPDNPETFKTLQNVYEELFKLGTAREIFHIGDDEVVSDCWKRSGKSDVYKIWVQFTNNMLERVKLANNGTLPKNIVLWSSPLTDHYINSISYQKELVVQFWFGQFTHILENGYKIIFSTVGQWYLDCGFGPWKKLQDHGSCDPYTDWKKFYKYRPWNNYSNRLSQVLGGEVCLWSEQVSADDLETRLWPRTAAFAERVWSDPPIFDTNDVYNRFDFHVHRLSKRGLRVAAIWPEFCSQFPDRC